MPYRGVQGRCLIACSICEALVVASLVLELWMWLDIKVLFVRLEDSRARLVLVRV